jgi:hypothetical protein
MQLVEDVGAFVLSRATRAGLRVARHARRRYQLHCRLRGTVGTAGAVELQRSIDAPISRSRVAACRIVVERRTDDGAWSTVFDEARAGALEVRGRACRVRVHGPLDLMVPWGIRDFGAEAARRVWSAAPSIDDEDLRVTEYLLLPQQQVHLFGLAELPPGLDDLVDPYRSAPLTEARWSTRPLISAWPRSELPGLLWRHPELLPPK